MDDTNVFDHSVFEEMHCNQKEQEQAHYHFALGEIVYYIQQYGIDQVMIDVYDLLASEGNAKIKQMELDYAD